MIPFKTFIKKSANTTPSQPTSSQTNTITTQQQTWINGAFSEEVK